MNPLNILHKIGMAFYNVTDAVADFVTVGWDRIHNTGETIALTLCAALLLCAYRCDE